MVFRTDREIYDISVLLGEQDIAFPGDTKYKREIALSIEESGICNVSRLTLSSHSGTHIDAQSHRIKGGKTIDQYPVERFILPAQVVCLEGRKFISAEDLKHLEIQPGDALLLKTDNSKNGLAVGGKFLEHFVYLAGNGADYCVQKKVSLVGIDYSAIDEFGNAAMPSHKKLLGKDVLILEGINLRRVPEGRYTLICLPLKLKDSDGGPVRAVLVR